MLLQNWLARSSAAGSGGGGGEAENSLLKAWAAYGGALVPPWYYAVRGRFTDVTACHDSVCQLTVRAAARLELSPIHKRFPTVSCVCSAESLPSYFIQTLIQMNFMEGNLLNKVGLAAQALLSVAMALSHSLNSNSCTTDDALDHRSADYGLSRASRSSRADSGSASDPDFSYLHPSLPV